MNGDDVNALLKESKEKIKKEENCEYDYDIELADDEGTYLQD